MAGARRRSAVECDLPGLASRRGEVGVPPGSVIGDIENVADWPILHALGAPDTILHLYKKAWEGHLRQYTEAKTVEVPFARDGICRRDDSIVGRCQWRELPHDRR